MRDLSPTDIKQIEFMKDCSRWFSASAASASLKEVSSIAYRGQILCLEMVEKRLRAAKMETNNE